MSPSPATVFGVRRLLVAAGKAPSVHNTQPWRFAVSGEEPGLLAAVRMADATPASGEQRELYDLIPVRRTSREPFFERQVPLEHPLLAVLTTPGDRPLDWLRAGQALQRVLLVATAQGLSASFLNQPLDLRDMRHRRNPHHRRGHPQMIIRLGYGPYVARPPRRPASELETSHV